MSTVVPDPNHAEILSLGAAAWNAWREKNPDTIPRLNGIAPKLAERQMGPINGGPTNLKYAQLQAAFLRFATFSQADLRSADLTEADLTHARLDRADLTFANLDQAVLDHSDLESVNLTNASLRGASLRFASLADSDLNSANLSGADLNHARFDRAQLFGTDLSNALLDHADFEGAQLHDVDLSGANLYHAKNLTGEQLRETRRSELTLLPPYIKDLSQLPSFTPTDESVGVLHIRGQAHFAPREGERHSSLLIGVILVGVSLGAAALLWGLLGRQLSLIPRLSLPSLTDSRPATAVPRIEPSGVKPVSKDHTPEMHVATRDSRALTLSSRPIEPAGGIAPTALANIKAAVPGELSNVSQIPEVFQVSQSSFTIELSKDAPALNTTNPPALTATEDAPKVELASRSPEISQEDIMHVPLPPLPVRKPGVRNGLANAPSRNSTTLDPKEKQSSSTARSVAKSAKREGSRRNERIQSDDVSPTDVLAGGL